MSTSPNLLVSHIAASQNSKEVTANNAFDTFDEAMNSVSAVAITDADYTFPTTAGTAFYTNFFFQFTGVISATRNIILPSHPRYFMVQDLTTPAPSSTQGLTFKCGANTLTATINDGNPHLMYSDGVGKVWKLT